MIDRDSDRKTDSDPAEPPYDPEDGPPSADEPVATPMDAVDSESSFESLDAPPAEQSNLREELRNRLGLSNLQWNLLVSILIALPYPFFIYVIINDLVTGPWFLLFTLAYSLVAIVVTFYL